MSNKITIKNCRVVNEKKTFESDLLIQDGRIERIDSSIEVQGDVIDAKGLYLLPGVIDDQVHFREPGLTDRGSIKTESLSAIAGGTTSFMDMPNVIPPTLTNELWKEKIQIASENASANYSFYMGSSNNNIEEIKSIDPDEVCGLKVFMGSSTGNLLVDDEDTLDSIFKESPVIIATHCEDTPMIEDLEQSYLQQYGQDIPIELHAEIRSRESCLKSSVKAVDLANKHNANLHILHISTKDELDLFSNKNIEDKLITAEVCVPHLYFSKEDYQEKGSLIKCNPSVKDKSDQEALRKALKEGYIDFVATDHAPHALGGKSNSYLDCPSGMPSIQHTLLVLLELVKQGEFNLEDIPNYTSHNVSERFKIKDRGYVREGYWADLVLVDLNSQQTVSRENVSYYCGWSPFEGDTFHSKIVSTFVNGNLVYSEGKILEPCKGVQLEFNR